MKIEDLRCFLSVAECGSITKAAQKHYLTQQGLSRIISKMERELCTKLLIRTNNKITLTEAGELTAAYAASIDEDYRGLIDALSQQALTGNRTSKSQFTIYSTPILCTVMLPNILSAMSRLYPGVHFSVIEMEITDLADEVLWTENSMGIVTLPHFLKDNSHRITAQELHFEQMFRDCLTLGVNRNHPLAGKKQAAVEDMASLPFALYYTETNTIKQFLGDRKPNVLISSTNLNLCHEMAEKGEAVSIWSGLVDYYEQMPSIVQVPVEKKLYVDYGCLWDKQVEPSPIALEVVAQARREFRKITKYLEEKTKE